ncbi:thioredoxin family protein [Planctomycetota bacterium]
MDVKVLGPGCMKCRKLFAETEKAIAESGIEADLAKVERIDEIANYGVMMTPALVIEGTVKCVGKIPSTAQIATWLKEAAAV